MDAREFDPGRQFDTMDTTLGVEFEFVEDGHVRATMPVTDKCRQPYGLVHGGAYAMMAESSASAGTFIAVHDEGKIALGMSNQTSFLRSITAGTVHADARAIYRGRTTWVWEVEITDDAGDLCAVSRMTIAVRPRPAGK